jgi:protein kinase-like protein/PEGA domain-containing protein
MPALARDPIDASVQEDLRELFRLEMLYARGPTSRLYLARDLEYDQPVALKVMPRSPQAWARAEEAFHEAAAEAAVLAHPHVVPLNSAGATDRLFWYSSEFVTGRSLAELLRAGPPMELDACVKLAEQIAAALDGAHRLGVVHANLKPSNVLLDAGGHVRVTDFWIRWVLEQLGASVGKGNANDGEARDWPGPYLSPEQRVGHEPGPAADQYALGALVYECLAGAPPHAEDPMAAVAEGRSPTPPQPLIDVRPDVPADVSAAVERALSQAPDGRYETAGHFVAALRAPESSFESVSLGPLEVAPARAPAHVGRPARHGIGLVSVALLAFVIVGAAGAAWILGLGLTGGQPIASQPAPTEPSPDTMTSPAAASTASSMPRPDATVGATGVPVPPVAARPVPKPIKRAPPAGVVPPARPRRDAPSRAPGRLFVNAIPWGQVFVDDASIGNTPRVAVPIAPGTHRVRVSRDGFEPFERTVQVAPGQDVRLTDIVLRESKQ